MDFGNIQSFVEDEDSEEDIGDSIATEPSLQFKKNEYVWFSNKECFALVVKKGDQSIFKVPKLAESDKQDWQFEEIELSAEQQQD